MIYLMTHVRQLSEIDTLSFLVDIAQVQTDH